MFAVALIGVAAGFAFLVAALVTQDSSWAWGCLGACAVVTVLLLVDTYRRRRQRQPDVVPANTADPDEEQVDAATSELVAASARDVLVVDEQPLYHLSACPLLGTVATLGLAAREAVTLGFRPCGRCRPARTVAAADNAGAPIPSTG